MFKNGLVACPALCIGLYLVAFTFYQTPLTGTGIRSVIGAALGCEYGEIIVDCDDDYSCYTKTKEVIKSGDFNKCNSGSCTNACSAQTGTYQVYGTPLAPGVGDRPRTDDSSEWSCGKKYDVAPSCSWFGSDNKCACTTTATPNQTNCKPKKLIFDTCDGN